jgi:hypothetical protein
VKRNWTALLGYIAILLLASPSESWSRVSKRQCSVTDERIKSLLKGWGNALDNSTTSNPGPILKTYADNDGAVLLATCSDEPLKTSAEIKSYFEKDFLILHPKVQIDPRGANIGVACDYGFASGLYTFTVTTRDGEKKLLARYTYVFRGKKIVQHHSSLLPKLANNVCPSPPS